MKDYFSIDNLADIFEKKISTKKSKGIDKRRPVDFSKIKENEFQLISDRVKNGNYSFSPYLEILKIKGRNKYPRVLASPTVRDKLALTALKEYLHDVFPESVPNKLPNSIVHQIKSDISYGKYRYFYRTDISGFYSSINRGKLISIIKRKIDNEFMLSLIVKAVDNETIPSSVSKQYRRDFFEDKGVPQGLPISNILAQVYLHHIDLFFESKDISYYRYVDDILILSEKPILSNKLILKYLLCRLDLKINISKTESGLLCNDFDFLGYQFSNLKVTLAEYQVAKFISRITGKITWYKRGVENPESRPDWLVSNLKLYQDVFIDELNEKITGSISENKKYGWLFYFIEIDDLSLLYKIDSIICGFFSNINSFDNKPPKNLKSIVKAYFDIKYNKSAKYIHNYNNYSTINEKRNFLVYRGKINPASEYSEVQIVRLFNKYRSQRISILEKDIGYY